MTYYDHVTEAADAIKSRVREVPRIAIVLGSGLGDFAGSLDESVSMPYEQLPHWPASRVVGHEGRLVVGKKCGTIVAALAGRAHAYEGHDLLTVTFAVRALGVLGVKTLILTNAAGGINTSFAAGALMVIDDHINLIGMNPLVIYILINTGLVNFPYIAKFFFGFSYAHAAPLMAPVWEGVATMAVQFVFLYWLYRRKLFWRV